MIKNLIYPGWVKSKYDGDWHYITGGELIRLYKLPHSECKIILDEERDLRGINKEDYNHYYPSYHGLYNKG
jgi:hypothetical protein